MPPAMAKRESTAQPRIDKLSPSRHPPVASRSSVMAERTRAIVPLRSRQHRDVDSTATDRDPMVAPFPRGWEGRHGNLGAIAQDGRTSMSLVTRVTPLARQAAYAASRFSGHERTVPLKVT